MDICNKHFKTKKSLEEYVRGIISTIGVCRSVKTTHLEYYNFLVELFRRHPKYPDKIKNMIDIYIAPNKITPKNLELNLIRIDGSIDDISWKNCISGKERDKFNCALRVAVDDQIMSFRNFHTSQCAICNTTDATEYHVDHINHFEEIVFEFLQIVKRDKPSIFQNTIDNRKAFTDIDKEYEDEWALFHKTKACLRILCSSCNLSRPKWKSQ
jgi:hypothetical protein